LQACRPFRLKADGGQAPALTLSGCLRVDIVENTVT
ncbi:hypothetical protein LCGC14_1968950, partial [marine sediment metagenome]